MAREVLKEARQKAGMTQQQMADRLGINLRHYQKIEYAEIGGSFDVWDALEDILGIHQRKLREISNNHPCLEESQPEH
ncbi:helix-turn-helix domain-containing protein [Diplocloster modestus]|uniref:helix-turn-helix domain-containing protein n=1 Tax=Diplocloster modestus TaxID=2850322 RepID=UPI00130E1657|nr:helix-turn-helix transcriptional regulator [Diplocloster modestus]